MTDVLVDGVRPGAFGAQAVEYRNAQRRREVAVGDAAGGAFAELDAQLRGQRARLFVERRDGRRPLHRRTIDAAIDSQRHARVPAGSDW